MLCPIVWCICFTFPRFYSRGLQCLTVPNVVANLPVKSESLSSEVRFFDGDWSEVHKFLPNLQTDDRDSNPSSWSNSSFGYDIILMAETVYTISTLSAFYELIKNVTRSFIIFLKCKKQRRTFIYLFIRASYFRLFLLQFTCKPIFFTLIEENFKSIMS